jgi:Arm DNA-binding domain
MGRLTLPQIRNLKEPGRCNDGDGLFLELTAPIKGNWQLRATVSGRRRDIGLGSLALVSLKEARDVAFELRCDLQRGIDPVAERNRRKLEILTFKAAALRVHTEQKASWRNGKHQDQRITTL